MGSCVLRYYWICVKSSNKQWWGDLWVTFSVPTVITWWSNSHTNTHREGKVRLAVYARLCMASVLISVALILNLISTSRQKKEVFYLWSENFFCLFYVMCGSVAVLDNNKSLCLSVSLSSLSICLSYPLSTDSFRLSQGIKSVPSYISQVVLGGKKTNNIFRG